MNFYTITFIALLILKLANLATISWWIVFSPFIAWPIITFFFIAILAFIKTR